MKKLLLIGVAACLSVVVSAQKVYFLYLQTDDQSPFYVRLSDKIYSSAVSGFLILPNLTDSTYNINVGFAKSSSPETRFAVTINQNDKGFLIKNFSEGLSLFDLQNLSLIKPATFNKDNTVFETKSDKFSAILSKAADDPSLLKVAVVKKEEVKLKPEPKVVNSKTEDQKAANENLKDTASTTSKLALPPDETKDVKEKVVMIDSPVVTTHTMPAEEVKQTESEKKRSDAIIGKEDYKSTIVIRHAESSTTEGLGIIYFDRAPDKTDTIRILIPPSKNKFVQEPEPVKVVESNKKIETVNSEPTLLKTDSSLVKKVVGEKMVTNSSSCEAIASDKDFMKLRKNMAARSNDEDMIAEARKSYKNKCFTAEQVRYLSTLFLTSAAKYQFLDSSYSHISDKGNFAALQSEIKDEYYLKRFKALIGE